MGYQTLYESDNDVVMVVVSGTDIDYINKELISLWQIASVMNWRYIDKTENLIKSFHCFEQI